MRGEGPMVTPRREERSAFRGSFCGADPRGRLSISGSDIYGIVHNFGSITPTKLTFSGLEPVWGRYPKEAGSDQGSGIRGQGPMVLSQKTSSKTRFLKSSPLQIRQLILCSPHKLTICKGIDLGKRVLELVF